MKKIRYNPFKMMGFWTGLLIMPFLILVEFMLDENQATLTENWSNLSIPLIIVFAFAGWILQIFLRRLR